MWITCIHNMKICMVTCQVGQDLILYCCMVHRRIMFVFSSHEIVFILVSYR